MTSTCKICDQPLIKEHRNHQYHKACWLVKKRAAAREQWRKKNPTGHKPLTEKKCECCGAMFLRKSNIQKYCGKTCYRSMNIAKNFERKKQHPKTEAQETAWAIPAPPKVPKFTKMVHRIFYEMRSYA